jgi:hypothetical protein
MRETRVLKVIGLEIFSKHVFFKIYPSVDMTVDAITPFSLGCQINWEKEERVQ